MAAILVFMREISSNAGSNSELALAPLLAIFGLILSIIGFLVCISLAMGHQNYIANIVVILHHWEATDFYRDWKKSIHYKDFHRMFFEIIAAFFVVLSLYYGHQIWNSLAVFKENSTLLLFVFILAFVHFEMCYRLVWKKEFDKRKDFIKKLHPTFYQEVEDC